MWLDKKNRGERVPVPSRPAAGAVGTSSATRNTACRQRLKNVAVRKLDMLEAAVQPGDLARPPGNKLERLHRDREGQHSIRINDQWRICFRWTDAGPEDVEITDYH